jgi:hypothetical protein
LRNPESSAETSSGRLSKARSRKGRTGDDDGRASRETLEVVLQPGDVENIQVVGGLVEEEDIGLGRSTSVDARREKGRGRLTSKRIALARASFIFHPPERDPMAASCLAPVNPTDSRTSRHSASLLRIRLSLRTNDTIEFSVSSPSTSCST